MQFSWIKEGAWTMSPIQKHTNRVLCHFSWTGETRLFCWKPRQAQLHRGWSFTSDLDPAFSTSNPPDTSPHLPEHHDLHSWTLFHCSIWHYLRQLQLQGLASDRGKIDLLHFRVHYWAGLGFLWQILAVMLSVLILKMPEIYFCKIIILLIRGCQLIKKCGNLPFWATFI